ncbi:PREDICTED: FUN14 domain-containing protein 1-like [Nicrophorus vespilloides]|uniref:FUN14 domain-containing protein 1-like n=1 Tax=Nicrophorus vespilloides TaxID=110193 RepID=A0ABM1NA68_NICVS|nr:PREDICTED: FUN14 domain-containing protein 1-like [Nicrophorus vespilloides]
MSTAGEKTVKNYVLSNPTTKKLKNCEEMSRKDESIIDKIAKHVGESSPSNQLLVGSSSGMMIGFISMKIGKIVALVIGGGILLMQLAKESNFIKINWNRINNKLDKFIGNAEGTLQKKNSKFMTRLLHFTKTNVSFTSSFAGGFFIAVGCS